MIKLIDFYMLFEKKKSCWTTEYDVFCLGTERYLRKESSVGIVSTTGKTFVESKD